MRIRASKLHGAIISVLGAGTLLVGGAVPAIAQEAAQADASQSGVAELDRVQVTGTRLRQVDIETAQPITVIDRQEIEKQGFQTVGDILQNDPAMGAPPSTRASALAAGENVGGSYASMRRLGPQRTLVLVNGQRMGVNTSGFADLSLIPATAVERIEILKDGASSIYGSDAIAGVINVITRTDFDGATVETYLGQYSQGDGDIKKGSFVFGHTGDRYALTVGGEISNEAEIWGPDRDFSAYPRSHLHPEDGWAVVGDTGGFVTSATNRVPGLPNGTRVILRPGGDPRNINDFVRQDINTGSCLAADGATAEGGCVPGSSQDKANGMELYTVRMPMATRSLFGDFNFDLTDNVSWRTSLLYSRRSGKATLAGTPGPPSNWAPSRDGMSADSYFNPTGAVLRTYWRRTSENPRAWDRELETYRLSSSLNGSFRWGERHVDWDVGMLYSLNKTEQIGIGHINTVNLQKSVGPSFMNDQGRVQCGTAADPIPFSDCVPFNPFLPMGVIGEGGLTGNQELLDFLSQPFLNRGETRTRDFTANVATTLFPLPAGDVGIAVGVERRVESGEYIPAEVSTLGLVSALSAGPTRGSYSVNEAYVETEIPLLSGGWMSKELTLSLASRYSDYNTFGDTTNNKIGIRWRPTDTLLLRATLNDGFRAPTISDLYGGGSTTFPAFTDPCDTVFGSSATNPTTRANCARDLGALADSFRQLAGGFIPATRAGTATPVPFLSSSNPDLQPEQSKSQTIGVVWSPGFLSGFTASVDWWKMRIENTIVTDNANLILRDCYVLGLQSRCEPNRGTSFTRNAERGYIEQLTFSSTNAGMRKVEGFDMNLSYRTRTRFGAFGAMLNSTYLARNYTVSTNEPRLPISDVGQGVNFRIRSRLNLTWDYKDFGVTWSTRYSSSMQEACTYFIAELREPHLECNTIHNVPTGNLPGQGAQSQIARRNRLGSNSFHDIQVRWRAPWDANIAIGANNVFEHYGPVMYSAPASSIPYYGGFDMGRFIYLKYKQNF